MEPNEIADLARRVHDAEGWNLGASSSRETRNKFWARVVGMVHHGFPEYGVSPDPRWHLKNAAGRPQSDDVAVRMPDRHFWDFIGNVGADPYTFGASADHGPLPMDQDVWPPPVPDGYGVKPNPSPIGSPWTAQHDDIVARLGTPNAAGDVGFVRRVAQQFRYTFGPGWGMKRAAPDRDLSNNVLGYQSPAGLFGFKVVPVRVKPEPLTLPSPQVFASVEPVDHLGLGSAPPVVTPPPPVDPPVAEPAPGPDPGLAKVLEVIVAGLADVSTRLQGVEAAVEKQRSEVLAAVRGQSYEFSINLPNFMGGQRTGTISPKAPAKE